MLGRTLGVACLAAVACSISIEDKFFDLSKMKFPSKLPGGVKVSKKDQDAIIK